MDLILNVVTLLMLWVLIVLVNLYYTQNISPQPRIRKFWINIRWTTLWIVIVITFFNIDNNYDSQTINSSKLVHYDGVLGPDKHQSTNSASYSTPSVFPRIFLIFSL